VALITDVVLIGDQCHLSQRAMVMGIRELVDKGVILIDRTRKIAIIAER